MPKHVALSIFRDKVREVGEFRDHYTNDVILDSFINFSASKFYTMVATADPLYYSKTFFSSVMAENEVCDLPSDFWRIVGVEGFATHFDGVPVADSYEVLESFSFEERKDTQYSSTKSGTRWLIKGIQENPNLAQHGYKIMILQPAPMWSGTLKIDYIPQYKDLDDPTDYIDTVNFIGFTWIVNDVAAQCCRREQMPEEASYIAARDEAEKVLIGAISMEAVEQKSSSVSNTLQSLWRAVRNRFGDETLPREKISDAQLTAWINSSYKGFVDLVSRSDISYFRTSHYFSLVSGTRLYDLPTDFYKEVGVAILDNTNPDGYCAMRRFNREERFDYSYVSDKWNTRYDIIGDQIEFSPTPRFNSTIQLDYIPITTELVNPTDTYKRYNGWEEWVVLDVCEKVASYIGNPQIRQFFIEERAKVEMRIKSFAKRDRGRPRTVVDVNRWGKYDPRFWKWGNRGR